MGNIKTKFIAESVCVPGDCNVTNVPPPAQCHVSLSLYMELIQRENGTTSRKILL